MREQKPKKIAIVKLSALGDIVHCVIVLQFIKKHLPNSEISWVVDKRFSQILQNHPLIDRLLVLPLKDKKLKECVKILKNAGDFDAVIDFQGLLKSAIITKMLGKNSYGFGLQSAKEAVAGLSYKHRLNISYNENIIIRNLSLAAFALDFNFTRDEILAKLPCFDVEILDEKRPQKRIIIAPFASEDSKCYDKFKDVINMLKEYEIFITQGNQNELKKANELALNTHAKVLEKLSLNELTQKIANADLLIGNDSGITHIAWAVNVASITLFGNRPSRRNTYTTERNLVVDTGKQPDARSINKNDFCIREILPETIANFAKRLLNG
ncbi:lipopolysaccharide heptosyltransferase I [Campylobacter mucosalis]|uniref:lipopolysaccharide heptosyltransferase I n=1 Tax=Campylobacter mucosalis TaxID=202 RepID=UPI0014701B63|nr:lipopolysaccharide heptosyltransferase I [Campylobacter mucosalis]